MHQIEFHGLFFQCEESGCHKVFDSLHELNSHLKVDHDVQEGSFECPHPGCFKVFNRVSLEKYSSLRVI
jgi:hypothetical protein